MVLDGNGNALHDGMSSHHRAHSTSGITNFHTYNDVFATNDNHVAPIISNMGGATGVENTFETWRSSRNRSRSKPRQFVQEPIAVVSMACRLPDDCNTPHAFWKFLERGNIARNTPPETRFSLDTHYDGSLKGQTMASPGGMFLQSVDPRDIDAQFFRLSPIEASSMDPQQRQLLEVVYEGLENAGVTMEELDGAPVGCFVGSFACDYADIQARDPENRAPATQIGVGRAMLSNRLSHFLNIKGPSMTVDTACSGSLICLDIACRYLQTREISSAIVAGANLYLSPEHVMDHYMGANGTASLSGKCHTFDEKADGYIKAEAVNMLYLKRLDDAIKDRDPIRAVIRGSATNSDGWTAGIASPNSEAQAKVTRQAYANAGITDLSLTSYVEFHGTGTRAGDAIEANGVASVFAPYHSAQRPLRVGSVKSNIGHSEPAAGISGLIKVILSLEKGIIPGNPTFITPNPKIDFDKLRIQPSRYATRWPSVTVRRASVNSFGYGGSNAHVVVDEARGLGHHVFSYLEENDDLFADEDKAKRPYVFTFSANDEQSLRRQLCMMDKHLSDPSVSIKLRDLAYTLSERRSRHYHRGYLISNSLELDVQNFESGTVRPEAPKVGYIFTGQGAQWSEMGKELLENFPLAARQVQHLDQVLREIPDPPKWTLFEELTCARSAERLRLPEISQPLVTALQLGILAVLKASGVSCHAVVGHSSGEIAAAVAAGTLTPDQAIKIAYYRGKATSEAMYEDPVGMMAVGLGPEAVRPHMDGTFVEIACINSPQSVTLSGKKSELVEIEQKLKQGGHFARLLLVDAAYHSRHMNPIGDRYQVLLEKHVQWYGQTSQSAKMFSSTSGKVEAGSLGPNYWVKNMVSPVLFSQALQKMITQENGVDVLIEIGPSNALSGPVNQIKKAASSTIEYLSAWKRGSDALQSMLELGGKLFTMGAPISLLPFNRDKEAGQPAFIADLPNYSWNHSVKYWHETQSSTDWRLRKFVHHDLLGSKILGSPWTNPTWNKVMRLSDVTWLRDHVLGESIVFPAAGYVAMAMEAMYQKSKATGRVPPEAAVNCVTYKLRNVSFHRMLTLEEDRDTKIQLSLQPCSSTKDSWHEFTISSVSKDATSEHCRGLVSIGEHTKENARPQDIEPFVHPTSASLWYKALGDVGLRFGPSFKRQVQIESKAGSRRARALIDASPPRARYPQSPYPMHPTVIDSCFQASVVSLGSGHRSAIGTLMAPAMIDELVIFAHTDGAWPDRAVAVSTAEWGGAGREDDPKRLMSEVKAYDGWRGDMLFHLKGLRYHAIDAVVEKQHTFTQVVWNEDISFLTPRQMTEVLLRVSGDDDDELALQRIAKVVSLCAHKKPSAKVLEVVLDDGPSANQSMWIDELRKRAGPVAEGCLYQLSSPSQKASLDSRVRYAAEGNIHYAVHEPEQPFGAEESVEDDNKFDVVLLKVSHITSTLNARVESALKMISCNGYLICIQDASAPYTSGPCLDVVSSWTLRPQGFETVSGIAGNGIFQIAYLGTPIMEKSKSLQADNTVHLVHMRTPDGSTDTPKKLLSGHGWNVVEHNLPLADVPPESTVMVLDEMFSPILSEMGNSQFAALKMLIKQKCRLLWVTKGAQMEVTNPEMSLVYGTARTLLLENPTHLIMCLDVESSTSTASFEAIHSALQHLNSVDNLKKFDAEFVERNGMYHICRVIPDTAINQAEKDCKEGMALRDEIIRGHKSTIRLITDRPGTLDTLVYVEAADQGALASDDVEVEIHAAALNFKDLANAMGFVAANDHFFGLEGAGIVTEVGQNVDNVRIGDRVLVVSQGNGCFANRVRTRFQGIHRLPDWMSFEEGATLGTCYFTVIHCLVNLANVQRGQSVLIHSATGGVGLAAIQLCKYLGAEIYATVGTDSKRDFLTQNYGIQEDHIFSSRSVTFANQLMKATNGRGVDVVLNSLSGDMLHESWRCIAENGNFIEIGKKDMLDRNSLSMEPFNRNASYRAIDMSRKSLPAELITDIGKYMLDLVNHGHVKPLHISKVFPFQETVDAFRYMQHGKHLGKIIISYENSHVTKLPVRSLAPTLQLRQDASYLIAGGFKGLCGSLAIYLARNGATNIVALARSGYEDSVSRSTIYNLEAMGCHVDLVIGDVTNLEDVRRAFKQASKPVAGVIQGAMVLRDRMFSDMTAAEFRDPIAPKVRGTWNLHTASLEQSSPLDFFTMLSSVSGIAGHMSQSNYSAGNVFQDAFAAYRLRLGLAACAVDLGLIGDVGYLVEHNLMSRLEAQGWVPIHEPLLHRILRASILQQTLALNPHSTGQLVTGITVPIIPPRSPIELQHRFSSLRAAAGSGADGAGVAAATSGDAKLTIMKSAARGGGGVDKGTLLATSVDVVNAVLVRSLGAAEPLEPSRPLASYGIDSLVAVELRNWARNELSIEVSGLEVVGAKTLVALCEVMLKKLMV